MTLLRGEVVAEAGVPVAAPGLGRFLTADSR
jgi:hypothetical protein